MRNSSAFSAGSYVTHRADFGGEDSDLARPVVAIEITGNDRVDPHDSDLAERTSLPPRTVRYGLDRLIDVDVVERRPCLRDARQSMYELVER